MARKKIAGIYFLINLARDKIYIGSSVDLKNRFTQHMNDLRNNKHCNTYLQRSFNKYGEENFEFVVIEYVEDKNKLIEREQYWISNFIEDEKDRMYNICSIAGNSLGYKHTEETKQKMSEQRYNKPLSESHRKSISKATKGENNPMYGKHHTEESKRKISENRIYKKGIDHPGYGKPQRRELVEERVKKVKESGVYKGENNPASKLTEDKVREIKILLKEGKHSQKQIAEMYNIGTTQISYIKKGKSWSHVKLEEENIINDNIEEKELVNV